MKSTKKALFTSALSLLLCVSMLVGTTFAWFTDSVTSGVNQIVAGNLDVEVMHTSAKVTTPASVAGDTELFRDVNGNAMLWEPGAVSYENFSVQNVGTLAFKYNMSLNITDYNAVKDTTFTLKDVLKVKVLTGDAMLSSVTRDAVAALDWDTTDTLDAFKKDGGKLYPAGTEDKASNEDFQVIVYWKPTDTDNNWNVNNGKTTTDDEPLYIKFGINVVATQLEHENDSFDNQYDKDAPEVIVAAGQLSEAIAEAAEGETIVISGGAGSAELPTTLTTAGLTIKGEGNDTVLTADKTAISASGVTLSDMKIVGSGASGTTGELNITGDDTALKNVTFVGEGPGVSGDRKLGVTVATHGENGVTFDKVNITNVFRGIQFWNLSGDTVVRDSVIDVPGYTFNVDAVSAGSTLTVENTTLKGWTSYTNGIELVTFKNCTLGKNTYAYLRPYSTTVMDGCAFEAGYEFNIGGTDAITVTLTNCSLNGVAITAENVLTCGLIDAEDWNPNATFIVNGTTVTVM